MNISYSAIDTFQTCPRKYKYSQIDRIKTPKSKEQIFGTLLHNTMKVIHMPGIVSPTLEQALDYFSKNWIPDAFSDETEERAAFSQGVSMIQDYYKKNDIARTNIVALESRFQYEVKDQTADPRSKKEKDSHIVTGIIDRIDRTQDGFEIIDYKTSRTLPSQEKVDNDLQLTIYLSGFLKRYPKELQSVEKLKVSLYYLKHGVKLSSVRTASQIKESEKMIADFISEIEKSDFEPKISALCDWCGFQNICPMWRHKFKEKAVGDDELKKLIDEYIKLKDGLKQSSDRAGEILEKIGKFMDAEEVDQVFSESGRILRQIRKTYKYDSEKLRQILEPLDKWEAVLKVDGIALRNIMGVVSPALRKEIERAKKVDKESKSYLVKKI